MKALLIDFGSTFTKVTLVNLNPPGLVGTSQAATTAHTDLMEGFERAFEAFSPCEREGISVKKACSSAAGGLRIVAVGMVPALTVKAARETALGAGARVLAAYAYTLTPEDLEEIRSLKPDLLLLTGGTDGGEKQTIIQNAALLADADLSVPMVFAGNRNAAPEVMRILQGRVPRLVVTANVMPEVNTINLEPARKAIRELYLQEITKAKGLDRVQEETGLAMPTPLAVMKAGNLIHRMMSEEVIVVDVGGATTDVHSFSEGLPSEGRCIFKGLPEPFAKRTVEGDLGVRVSALSLVDALGEQRLLKFLPFSVDAGELRSYAARLSSRRGVLPVNDRERMFDQALAIACISEALRRHAGFLTETYTPEGRLWVQQGKDLRNVGVLVGTGGVLVYGREPGALIKEGLKPESPLFLTPRHVKVYLDSKYILAAVGLLAEEYPEAAQALIRETLAPLGRCDF